MEKFINILVSNVSALQRMSDWRSAMPNFKCDPREQRSIIAACQMAFATTMLNTVDCFNVIEDKEIFYEKTNEEFPSLRALFNECLNFYEQIPHSFLEQLTADVEQSEKLTMALLFGFATWCLMKLEKVENIDDIKSSPDVLQFACVATYSACKEEYGI